MITYGKTYKKLFETPLDREADSQRVFREGVACNFGHHVYLNNIFENHVIESFVQSLKIV